MSRPFRIEAANNNYYVRNYGRKGVDVFKNSADLETFLTLLTVSCQRYGITCYCYTFLKGEFHILLHTSQANLAMFMRQLSGSYTQGYNKRYQLNGSLFKGRYQSSLLDPDNYPLWLSLYIHHLFLINSDTPQQVILSSCHNYLSDNNDPKTINTVALLQQLKRLYPELSYQQFLRTNLPSSIKELVNKKHLPAIIGGQPFNVKYQHLLASSSKECCVLSRMKTSQNTDKIIACTASAFQLPTSRILKTQYGHNKSSDARNMAMYLCQQHTNMTLKEIAKTFSVGHYASVSNRISHFKKTLKVQLFLQQCIEQVNKKLLNKIIIK